jgi:L-threonylcarbamoyladenylate synthase
MLRAQDPDAVGQAAQALADGELLAFPTETVYGLGARADDDAAVAKIFEAKGRPADHPLIVHVTDAAAAQAFAAIWPPAAQLLAQHFWPGPMTLIVPRRPGVATAAAGGHASVGLRCPDHPVALDLLARAQALGVRGVAGPSANRFGRVSPTTVAHVVAEFGPELAVLDGGACREGIESTIVDCTRARPALLRPGTTPRTVIEEVLRQALALPLVDRDEASPKASGTLASHYAPDARLSLMSAEELTQRLATFNANRPQGDARAQTQTQTQTQARAGAGVGVYSRTALPCPPGVFHRTMPAHPAQAAHELFAVLRELDAHAVRQIWVEAPPEGPEWDGVRDRLQRAATR